ncbi:MAG: glycosyltransferase family 2 protein, partial [Pseudobutyrivibrio sp.]|nr:glycosyltransferase family 2 protein [Pseudobutyrivibrio sp.]
MPSIKFSIVMPAYGVELYIGDALRCLAGQTYDNFEVIIVDDASPDRTGKIAQSFADKDDRFFVFKHEKNRGVA